MPSYGLQYLGVDLAIIESSGFMPPQSDIQMGSHFLPQNLCIEGEHLQIRELRYFLSQKYLIDGCLNLLL